MSVDAFSEDELTSRSADPGSHPSSASLAADCRSVWLEYEVSSFSLLSEADEARMRRQAGWSPAPEGVFCPRLNYYQRQLPDIPAQFSVKIETIDQVSWAN